MSTFIVIFIGVLLVCNVLTVYFLWKNAQAKKALEQLRTGQKGGNWPPEMPSFGEPSESDARIERALAMAREQTGMVECTGLDDSAPRYVKTGGADAKS